MKDRKYRLFLAEVYHKDRWLFFAFLLFIAGQIFFTWKGVETVPFFHWGMYSERMTELPAAYRHIELAINDSTVDIGKLDGLPVEYFQSMLKRYVTLKQNDFADPVTEVINHRFGQEELRKSAIARLANSPESEDAFRQWLCKYVQKYYQGDIHSIEILVQTSVWNKTKPRQEKIFMVDSIECRQ